MLNLLRYSQLIALAVLLAVVVVLSLLYRDMVVESLVEGETHASVGLTRAFANATWPQYAAIVRQPRSHPLRERAMQIDALERDLRKLAQGLPVVKVKVYDLHGITVFSTDRRQIGEDKSANPGFRRALRGVPASEITYRNRFDAWEGAIAERNIIATYVPVQRSDREPVEAVFEVYSDVTDLVERMRESQRRILLGVLGAMALVWLVVQLMLSHFQRRLAQEERQRQAQEEWMRHQAFHDPVTGLPNRVSFAEHLGEAVKRAKRAGWNVALLFVDLDLFKRVNDSLGHDAGDRLLRIAGECIGAAVREADLLFRMGGDEFTVLLEDVRGPEEAGAVAGRILEALGGPMQLEHHDLAVSASIGIALYPRDGIEGESLVKCADTAMYRAKELGRGRYAFFAPGMSARVETQLRLEAALRCALKNEEFTLHFQPRIAPATGRAVGVEALLRWRHPERGLVEPAQFMPVLEETGLIVPVGTWVLAEACRQAKSWQASGHAGLRVSVNISPRQFRSEGLPKAVGGALRASGLPPGLLQLELTEHLLADDADSALDTMHKLKALGVSLSIDHFGSGCSSLACLKRFPIDSLKLDRRFVRDLAASPKDAAIVDAICLLARSLGMGLVAEGVEEHWQAEYLRQRHCTGMQGYLFGGPLPPQQVPEALGRGYAAEPAAISASAAIHSGESLRQGTT